MLFLKKFLMSFPAVISLSLSVHSMEEYSSDSDVDAISSLDEEHLPHSTPVPIIYHIHPSELEYDSYDTFLAAGGCGGGGTPPLKKETLNSASSLSEDSFSPYQNHMSYSSLFISDSPLFEIEKFVVPMLDLKSPFKTIFFPMLVFKKEKEVVNNCFPLIPADIWKNIFRELSQKDISIVGATCLRFAVLTEKAKYVFKDQDEGFSNLGFSNYCLDLQKIHIPNSYVSLSDNERISFEEIGDEDEDEEDKAL